ncbi:SRC kinase signaling inhibitor 1 isoform X11 [Hemicordylus capensis]|nr:SRC kinase signaling inhibitor 1 isoform X11 [Hemicordylus capensis]XP_053115934.1 SRC kinase signaling inhibitor 1 isoform X11 [Hemicordylus capensis]XP_053115936.1 SRC kinase signaling inhibitor 1 isoform X11 [Hemicordylus capensis]XP_053115937.1 SRC kinase signaling inhibitor 1 isoform X11 [Hemicordylus capensis]XP_053115938.1 SRC kinase signaling inhibitor 1 isoform X11 [Hemicordylus capensis]XP_053115939.1 SRC kinase signaling inhibitor 1 isoform X11 [Hemicordylus capensis]
MISADDAEYPREYRTLGNGTRRFSNVGLVHTSERRHTVIAAQSLEALTGLQKSEMERKRDAFMDHLKSKYPQHALAIRGQQERIRDQQPNYWSFKTRSSRHSQGSQPGLADQAKLSFASAESLETMSEAELPIGFNRMNRFRQSLPLSRSTSQTKLRSPGILFLQFGDETRRVHITHEISSMDTLHALIVHMFPQKLTMGMLKSPNTAILIKDESRNVFYELEDVRDIQDRSIIKIYRKEPLYASFPGSHITNGDLRREMVYTSRESSPTRRLNSMSPAAHLTSGSPPPVLQSSSPSRSRMSYSGGRPPSYAGSPVHHGERLSNLPPAQGVSPSPSAILERRDVKPDEDMAGKNMMLMKNEGLYADPYSMVHEGRLSITSTQSLAGMGDPFAYPGGLYKRGSVRSLSTYSAAALQSELEDSLYKPNAQIYSDTYGPGLGFRLPPSSPQKIADGRLVDVQQSQSPHSPYSGPPSRSSPVRQSFRKDSCSSVFIESPVNKPRNPSSSGPPELFPGPGERPLSGFSSPVPAKDTETRDRMEAMEKQIASLTGLVQSALMRSSDTENPSERTEGTNGGTPPSAPPSRSGVGTPVPGPPPPSATSTPAGQPTAITRLHMQLHLHDLQQNASDLRNQLQQLKKLQLQNQETVKTMLRRTETEISVRVTDTMRKQEDPLQRQRTLVEEERLRYLNEEELITQQLNDMEKSVEKIQKDLTHNHRLISTQELEEKFLVLKQLGDTLMELKANFPSLQSKMRVVLRVEVEAVKFLKEEPHRLDGLFKRCKAVTDTLAQVRKQVDEGVWDSSSNLLSQSPKKVEPESDFSRTLDFEVPMSPPMNFHDLTASTDSLGTTSYGQSQGQSHLSKGSNPSRGSEMVAVKTQTGSDTPSKRSVDRSVSVEAAERDWEEKRAALTQYSAKDINRLLEETQAELMKAIPDLEFAAKHKQTSSSGSAASTPEHKPAKPQHAQKTTAKMDPNGRRGSDELTVPRYRTEKPSKSPPPPPPRRSFPSSHGLTTTRTGEVIVTSKKESSFMKKAESEELETQKPQVKLRRTVSEVARPASTPPIIASAIKDDDDEDRIIAELEVFQRSSSFIPKFRCDQLVPTADMWPNGATLAAEGWKAAFPAGHCIAGASFSAHSLPYSHLPESQESGLPMLPSGSISHLPHIVLSEWASSLPSLQSRPESGFERNSLRTGNHKCTGRQSGGTGQLTMVEINGDSKSPEVLLEKLSKNERKLKSLACASFALFKKASTTYSHSLPASARSWGSWPDPGIGLSYDVDHATRGDTVALEAVRTSQKDKVAQLEGEDMMILNVGDKQTRSQQISFERTRVHAAEIQEAVMLSEVTFDYKTASSPMEGGEMLTGLDSKNHIAEPKNEDANQGKEEVASPLKAPDAACRQIQRDHLSDGSRSCLPLQNPKFPVNKEAIEHDIVSRPKPVDLVQEKMKTEIGRELVTDLEEKQRECASLDAMTLSSREICKDTYQRLDHLEETIRDLQMTITEISHQASTELMFPQNLLEGKKGKIKMYTGMSGCNHDDFRNVASGCQDLKWYEASHSIPKSSASSSKPPLLPKPQFLLNSDPQSGGGVSIPAMKMVNPASRLKQTQQGSPDKSKHIKQRMEYMRIQGQQQCAQWLASFLRPQSKAARSTKDPSTMNETSSPVSEKPTSGRTSIPVLTSFGSRNSSISF